jgi:hypothetical protein
VTDPTELLESLRAAGVRLTARGDRLIVTGPPAVLTAEVREALARVKPALLPLLEDHTRYVTLRGGFTVPVEALTLALDLERRGFTITPASDGLRVEPDDGLTPEDRAGIARWGRELAALADYADSIQ